MTESIRLLVVDDHPVVRDGLVLMLETQPDFDVVAQANSGMEALAILNSTTVDVVLLDLEMPEMDGVETLTQIVTRYPQIGVLVFTAFDTDERIVAAVRAGAKGYLLKGARRQEIFEAIRVIHGGGSLLQPVVASKLMQHLSQENAPSPANELTSREQEVLQHLSRGHTNRDIADTLFITERTVKFHVSSILSKLGAENRTEAVRIAMQQGLVSLDDAT